jgi:hypothetical protein
MLRTVFTFMLVATLSVACAQDEAALKCDYTSKVVYHLPEIKDATYLSEVKGVDPDSQEETVTHTIQFANEDTATLEQKYCSMYNFQLRYKIKELNQRNFEHCLDAIDKVIRAVKQDYKLKAPLKSVVDMNMNQRGLSLKSPFSFGLPAQAVNSSEYVENTITFTPQKGEGQFDAEVEFYFGLGGE